MPATSDAITLAPENLPPLFPAWQFHQEQRGHRPIEDDEPGRGVGPAAGPLQSLLPHPEVQGDEARALPDHG